MPVLSRSGEPGARRLRASIEAENYGGVLSRRLLRTLGIDRSIVAREVNADRWRLHGDQTVALHTAALSQVALRWRAIWEIGEQIAALDGASSLHVAGLVGFDVPALQVSVPHGSTPQQVPGVRWRSVIRGPDEVIRTGVPRTRTPIAAVRAGHWATTDRQAAFVLALTVQQRMATPSQLRQAVELCRSRGRVAVIRGVIQDLGFGVQTLGELDFARMCRRRGLPEPDRQVVVKTPSGRIYLDVRWTSIGLVVEIDGSGHRMGLSVTDDNLRQNGVALRGDVILRIDVIGLRVRGEEFMDQVCQAHAALTSARTG